MKNTTKKLKIGIVCYPSVGGSGIVATTLGQELAKQGHKIHFISYEKPFRVNWQAKNIFFHKVGINEYSLFKYPDYTLPLAETILCAHQKYKLDIVHVHYAVPHATAALLAVRMIRANKVIPPKIITTLHGTDITLLAKDPNLFSVIKYSVEKSSGVTAVSEDLKKQTLKTLKNENPIEVIHNFYETKPITKNKNTLKTKLGFKNNDFIAIHLSNLRPVKRIPDLLKVARTLKNFKNFKLLILAGGDFSPYEKLIKKFKLENTVKVIHNIPDIQNYINISDAGLFTSENESFGMGILEVMSYGKPVVSTFAGGLSSILNRNDGVVFEKIGDVNNLVKNLKALMLNQDLGKEMGKLAETTAKNNFSTKIISRKYLEYYLKTLNV